MDGPPRRGGRQAQRRGEPAGFTAAGSSVAAAKDGRGWLEIADHKQRDPI